jgi:uncharacterized DUF497 family protein
MRCHALRWRPDKFAPLSYELVETVPFRTLKEARVWARGELKEPILGTAYSMSREQRSAEYIDIVSVRWRETVERPAYLVPSAGDRGFW